MRLTARSEYGVLAMMDLATLRDAGPVSAREISEHQAIPAKFLEQLMVQLRQAGIVSAVRGARGGFELARDPEDITVLEVVEALEGPLVTTVCDGERADVCGRSGACAAALVWERATDAVKDVFFSTTLSDLVREQRVLESGISRSSS